MATVLRTLLVTALVLWLLLALLGRALAAEELAPVQTVSPLTDQILVWLSCVMLVVTLLAGVLPPHWRITQVLARLATDMRGIRVPDPRKVTKLPPIPRV